MPATTNPLSHITPMHVGGLRGRVLHISGPKGSREVLFVYGHHSSLERWFGIAKLISKHATATMPDLPGFGGMESLYQVGKSATINNLADWLAEFVKERYDGRKVTIVGMSLGFVIITRMLQRHPELTKNVSKLISLFGFAHKDDFKLKARSKLLSLWGARAFSLPVMPDIYKGVFLQPDVLRKTYHRTPNAKQKFKGLTPKQHHEAMDFEIELWQANDVRTHMKTIVEFLTVDNTKTKVDLPVYHIAVQNDRYFDKDRVEQHYRQIFSNYHLLTEMQGGTHAPVRVETAEQAKALMPLELLKTIAKT